MAPDLPFNYGAAGQEQDVVVSPSWRRMEALLAVVSLTWRRMEALLTVVSPPWRRMETLLAVATCVKLIG